MMYIEQMKLVADEIDAPIVIDKAAVVLHDWVADNFRTLPTDEAAAMLIFGSSWLETRAFRASMMDRECQAA
jgi:hypothetical protein